MRDRDGQNLPPPLRGKEGWGGSRGAPEDSQTLRNGLGSGQRSWAGASPPSQPSPSRGEGRRVTRRAALAVLGGAAFAWPLIAPAQQGAVPVVGFLNAGSQAQWAHLAAAFRAGLADVGIVDGRDATIEYSWAEGDTARLPAMAAELVARGVAVIATGGGASAVIAAKNATTAIPIVFTAGTDPVKDGIVESLNHPDGNVTGVSSFIGLLGSKELNLLRELLQPSTVGVLISARHAGAMPEIPAGLRRAAESLHQTLVVAEVDGADGLDRAFATFVEKRVDAVYVVSDPVTVSRREQIVALAARHAVPALYNQREFTELGGLISYGVNFRDIYRQLGRYAARILKGAKPAELPVLLPTTFELVLNLQTAKALGLDISPSLLAQADEVIE